MITIQEVIDGLDDYPEVYGHWAKAIKREFSNSLEEHADGSYTTQEFLEEDDLANAAEQAADNSIPDWILENVDWDKAGLDYAAYSLEEIEVDNVTYWYE